MVFDVMYSAANDRTVLVERKDCKWQETSFPEGRANLRVDEIEIDEKEKFMCRKFAISRLQRKHNVQLVWMDDIAAIGRDNLYKILLNLKKEYDRRRRRLSKGNFE